MFILYFIPSNFSITFSQAIHSSVMISKSGTALRSPLLNISLTIDKRFHIPSGSLPLKGLKRDDHSAAAGGAVVHK